jgi:hypothetical protein
MSLHHIHELVRELTEFFRFHIICLTPYQLASNYKNNKSQFDLSHDSGYNTFVFSGKAEQRARVQERVAATGFLPRGLVKFEVDWFYDSLGIEVRVYHIAISKY